MKSYYIETPEGVADRVQLCLKHAPPERLSFAPDCGREPSCSLGCKQKCKTWSGRSGRRASGDFNLTATNPNHYFHERGAQASLPKR